MAARSSVQSPLIEAMLYIAEMEERIINIILEEISGPAAFDTDSERIASLSERIEISNQTGRTLLSLLSFLYSDTNFRSPDGSPDHTAVTRFVKAFPGEQGDVEFTDEELSKIVEHICLLIAKSESIDRHKKSQQNRKGFLPTINNFSTYLDLRPNFNNERTDIVDLTPIIQMRIITDDGERTKKDYSFQMDRRGLRRLKEAIETIEKKLSALENHSDLANLVNKV